MNWHSGVRAHFCHTAVFQFFPGEALSYFWVMDKWPPTAPHPVAGSSSHQTLQLLPASLLIIWTVLPDSKTQGEFPSPFSKVFLGAADTPLTWSQQTEDKSAE